MNRYRKGAMAEYEWMNFLIYKGFATIRAPSSGNKNCPVDVVAMKNGLVLAFEIKNHAKMPRLPEQRLSLLEGWCSKAGAIGLLAWRRKGEWLFLSAKDAMARRYDIENWLGIERLLEAIDFK
ncbi:MAG: hypothetical protein HYX24_03020 [Candidatus Aenigmarchaeota archaeon]|nr:hypothetical protein [Candidatus Aenigmarchaeota archaeon]